MSARSTADIERIVNDLVSTARARAMRCARGRWRFLDVDDIESDSFYALWIAVRRQSGGRPIEPLYHRILKRLLIRRAEKFWSRRRLRRLFLVRDLSALSDRAPGPVETAIFTEEVARFPSPNESPPCVRCGTRGGKVPPDCLRPTRIKGMCAGCYHLMRKSRLGLRRG